MKTALTIALIIAHKGFQPTEYQNTKKALENAGITVHTISTQLGEAEGTDGSKVAVDLKLDRLIPGEYQGIVFIGGSGALDYLDNEISYDIIKKAVSENIILGAICIAPRILAKAGILKDKKATGWDDDNELTELFKKHGTIYTKEGVVLDGAIVTATGPATATDFGKALAQLAKK
jgi:protease I